MLTQLEELLSINHTKEPTRHTKYQNIPKFKIISSTTNGTSGIGLFHNQKVYFHYNYTQNKFIVEKV
jgi:hypothetical protein